MSIKLSETQLEMVRAAAQRDDRCLTPSPTLKDGAAQKVAAKLIAAKLVREIKAKAGTPVWRRDGEGGQPLALKLTAAGRGRCREARLLSSASSQGAGDH